MRLVWQWIQLERELPENWTDVRLALAVREADAGRAAALLGGANPLRRRDSLLLYVSRRGGFGPEALRRALLRLDREGIPGTLELAGVTEAEAPAAPALSMLAAQWDAAAAGLPEDWSDMLGEVWIRSSDHLERAALLV